MDSKTRGIVSYITWIGWVVAFFTKQEDRDDFEVFHLRQGLGILLIALIPFIGWVAWIVFMIMGAMNASNGEKKHLPILGEHFENWFEFIK